MMDFPVGVAPLPVFKVPATAGTAHLHSIWINTPHPEAAWRLVKFLSSKEYQIDLVRSGLWMPNRTEMYTESGMREWLDPKVHPPGFETSLPTSQSTPEFILPLRSPRRPGTSSSRNWIRQISRT